MNLRPFLKADRVVMQLAGDEPRSILECLIEPLIKDGTVTDGERFLDDLERREAQITTVMDNGVAIPHARSHAVRSLGLVVGVTGEEGVLFDVDGDVRSQLFFCIAIPSFAPTAHIPMLQQLALFARDPARVEKILSAATPAVVARFLGAYKS
jgi:mannitol/fructose-specific phosphotransferase system IIA component (Ntr-type)